MPWWSFGQTKTKTKNKYELLYNKEYKRLYNTGMMYATLINSNQMNNFIKKTADHAHRKATFIVKRAKVMNGINKN